jgi:hypothetical protein
MNTKFKSHFNIPEKEVVNFVDIPLTEDLEAFICPFLIVNNIEIAMADEINQQMQSFLKKLNRDFIQTNDKNNGLLFLSNLHEPNEYHLGYSDANKGKAISKSKAEIIFDALRNNKASRQASSVTNEAQNVLLLVKGIGQDNMSDIIANVCRNLFAEYTEKICLKYSIPTSKKKLQYFNPTTMLWDESDYDLPTFYGKHIILIPKKLVSGSRAYSILYNWYVAKHYIAVEILNRSKPVDNENRFINKLKDGTKKAIIKLIVKVYGKSKAELIDFVLKYQGSLLGFQLYAKEHYPELDISSLI